MDDISPATKAGKNKAFPPHKIGDIQPKVYIIPIKPPIEPAKNKDSLNFSVKFSL